MLNEGHWGVIDKNGQKIREVDFDGRELGPDAGKNRS
jgi:hypothetical protein